MRALQSSVKTSLRIDEEGLLSLQFMMPAPRRGGDKGSQTFIEFWVRARLLSCRAPVLTAPALQCLPLDE